MLIYDFSSTEQATFAGMVRFEQSIVNQDDFQAELARDAAKVIARLPIKIIQFTQNCFPPLE